MRVLHLFDKYLNTTMNWAAELLLHTPDVEQQIAAPWIVKNEYHHHHFQYHPGPWQALFGKYPDSEWDGGWEERVVRGLESKTGWWLKRLEKLDLDVIHAHFGPVGVKALPLARKTGKPLVVSFYGYDYEKAVRVQPALRAGYHRLFTEAALCIALGPATAQLLENAGCLPSKIRIVPLSVDTRQIAYTANKPRQTPLRLLQVSSFTEKKGQIDTVVAFHSALKAGVQAHLTLIGETVEPAIKRKVEAYVSANHLAEHVSIQGFTENKLVRQRMQDFDVFMHPSHTSAQGDTEGLPVAILEALASGLPVISTYHADIPSAVQHGRNGLLTAPRDVDALKEAIVQFAKMDNLDFEQYRRVARQKIVSDFHVVNTAGQLRACYQEVCL